MRVPKAASCLGLCVLLCVACAAPRGSPDAMPDIQAGWRPDADSDEAGLWMKMDRAEAALRSSGRLITDPDLNNYVRNIACKLAGPHCADIRVYIVEIPQFNAAMAPNGAMQVWSGLFLRVENEAQLAQILSHEIGHYVRRHSVQALRDVRTKAAFLQIFGLAVGADGAAAGVAAGVGAGAGQLAGSGAQAAAQLATVGSIYAFSRENEREADEIALQSMVNAGYDPREAAKTWEALIKERDAAKEGSPLFFFTTHPNPEERIATLKALAEKATRAGGSWVIGREEYRKALSPVRAVFLWDELRRREFARSQVVLDRLFAEGAEPAELFFFQAELYRLRGGVGDLEKARGAYERALELGQVPPEASRGLGLVLWKLGDKTSGRASFERYLADRPQAEDREMIRMYIQQSERDEKR